MQTPSNKYSTGELKFWLHLLTNEIWGNAKVWLAWQAMLAPCTALHAHSFDRQPHVFYFRTGGKGRRWAQLRLSNDIDWLIEAHYDDVISNAEVEFDAAYLLNLFPAAIYVLYGWIPAQGPWHHIRAGIAHRKDTARYSWSTQPSHHLWRGFGE